VIKYFELEDVGLKKLML